MQHFKLPVEAVPDFKVMVGSGQRLPGHGIVQELPVPINGHTLVFPAYVLPVVGSDVVIGASWLATLGPVLM